MFKVKDRKGADFLLAPTHEEEITALIAKEVQSYRQLPIRVYQIGRKFRDELRARSGLLRGKEFLMKDLYTFDISEQEGLKTYDEVVLAYRRIMKRLGVPYAVVSGGLCDKQLNVNSIAHKRTERWLFRLKQIPETLEEHILTSSTYFRKVRMPFKLK